MDHENKDFFKYILGRIGKYLAINLGVIFPVMLVFELLRSFLGGDTDSFAGILTVCLVIANCTGILFGKLHQIQKLLESRDKKDT